MSLPEEDLIRLRHMRDAAQQALQFCTGRARGDLDADVMLRFALVHAVTGLAWPAIVGIRNRLVHAYFDIDTAMLWDILARSVPELLLQLQAIDGVGPWSSVPGDAG